MLTIHKFELFRVDSQSVYMPDGAEVISAGLDPQGRLSIWAAVDTSSNMVARCFYVFGTGNPIIQAPMEFVATVVENEFVWHIFEAV